MKKITVSKNGLQSMGLKVNMGKTKVIISGRDLHTLQTSGKYPCAVCRKDVGKNSILCSGCSCWVHKKCSDIPGGLAKDPDFRGRCPGNAWAIDRRPCVEVQLADEKLDVVNNFVYFGDCICQVEVLNLPLSKDATLHGESLKKSYPCLLVKQFLQIHVVKCITAASEGPCSIYQNVGLSRQTRR